ncbi:HPP family protein [Rheinheimera sp.]|uniref:HPP family protein n=1 Tax=Rheinheimera sp. TaxID=1869214 RepID=UPI0027B8BE8C|nr:HPP family protein [Rheinheimera sp.]
MPPAFFSKWTLLLARLGLTKADSQRLSALPLSQRLSVACCAAVALYLVTLISQQLSSPGAAVILLASMGASSVLLFALPNSPLAKPWSFLAGHFIPACIGLACSHLFTDLALMAAVTIALVLFSMYLFECMHPPGGATALVPVIASPQGLLPLDFLWYPVGLNMLVMLCVALLLNKWVLKRPILPAPTQAFDPVHRHHDAPPLKRLGVQAEDLMSALNSADTVLDIGEQDLELLYQQAQQRAFARQHPALLCGDIMSRDLIVVSPNSTLVEAWNLLQQHKIQLLPVVDANKKLLGVISLVDFLQEIPKSDYRTFSKYFSTFVFQLKDKKRLQRPVAELMRQQVVTTSEQQHIVALVPLLADLGLHHIPVINSQQQLTGMISQSDLIAALYQLQLQQGAAATVR